MACSNLRIYSEDMTFELLNGDISKKKEEQKGKLMLDLCAEEQLSSALFVALANTYLGSSWKSKGIGEGRELLNGAFRVVINTPEGPFVHQFENEYWDFFKCKEVDYIHMDILGYEALDHNRLLSMDRDVLFKSILVKDSGLAIVNLS